MTISQDGSKLLVAVGTGILDVFDVDRCTGLLSNWVQVSPPAVRGVNNWYGCSFSPDGTKIYADELDLPFNSHLYQWDLTAPNIPASKTLIYHDTTNTYWGQHQLGPDGKIYITAISPDTAAPSNFALSVIHDPNAAGTACNFQYLGLPLQGRRTSGNLPNLPNYSLRSLLAQQAEAGPSRMICPGASLMLGMPDMSGGLVTFAWSGPQLSDSTAAQPLATPDTSTWYYLTVTDTAFGAPCGVTVDSVLIVVADSLQLPVVNLGADTTICPSDSVRLDGSGTGFQYAWTGTPLTWIASPDSAVTLVSGPGSYFLTVVNPAGTGACFTATDEVKITEYQNLIPPDPAGADAIICRGDTVALGTGAALAGFGYQWSPNTGLSEATVVSPWADPTVTTTYFLVAQDSFFRGACAQTRDTVTITVEDQNLENLPDLQDLRFCVGECFLLGMPPLGGLQYAWSPVVGLDDPSAAMTRAQPAGTTVYTLTVVDPTLQSANCRERRFVVHAVADACNHQSFVAVNGDGIAEVLDLGDHAGRVALWVFDVAGKLVFASLDYRNDWSPAGLAHGLYAYRVDVGGDCPSSFVGKIVVMR